MNTLSVCCDTAPQECRPVLKLKVVSAKMSNQLPDKGSLLDQDIRSFLRAIGGDEIGYAGEILLR